MLGRPPAMRSSIHRRATLPERAENEGKERSCGIDFSYLFGHSKRLLQQSSIQTFAASASFTLAAVASTGHRPSAKPACGMILQQTQA